MSAQTGQKLRKGGKRDRSDALTGWAFMSPFMLLFLLVFAIPIVVAIKTSFYQLDSSGGGLYGGGEQVATFVGLANYIQAASNSHFWLGMGRVVVYTLVQVPIMIGFALALALLLDSFLVRRPGIFRLTYFLPFAIPGIIAAMIWLYLYSPTLSPLVRGLSALGININFLSPNLVLASMANMTTWTYTGYNMLIFLAALQAIPHDLYEAARIDGASGWQITTRIKIPLVRGAALLAVLLSIIGTIQLFNEPAVVSSQNVWMGKDYTPMMMAYNTMMGSLTPSGDGPASAISVLMAIIAGAMAGIYAFAQRKVD
ncbi:MAG: sugar ABC transporter permease [Actinomycetaceae bacterium]|nr:sugar ABC transporter permease [Actinomycetaceae bacterium]